MAKLAGHRGEFYDLFHAAVPQQMCGSNDSLSSAVSKHHTYGYEKTLAIRCFSRGL